MIIFKMQIHLPYYKKNLSQKQANSLKIVQHMQRTMFYVRTK
jgi:hypothetical protein